MTGNTSALYVGEPVGEGTRLTVLTLGWLLIASGIFGNVLIIVTMLTQRALHSAHNLYIVNLAVADLFAMGYTSPFMLLDLLLGYHPVVNRAHCSVNSVLLVTTFTVSIYTLVLIALNRYLSVCRNVTYMRLFSRRNIVLSCVVTWAIAAFEASLPIMTNGISATIYGLKSHTCTFDQEQSGNVFTIVTLFNFTVPTILITFFSASILRAWKQSRNRIEHWSQNENHQQQTTRRISSADVALIRSLILVFVLLIVVYVPAAVALMLYNLKIVHYYPADISVCLLLLMLSNHSINWLVYGFMNKNIKNGYRRQMLRCCGREGDISAGTSMRGNTDNRSNRTTGKDNTRQRDNRGNRVNRTTGLDNMEQLDDMPIRTTGHADAERGDNRYAEEDNTNSTRQTISGATEQARIGTPRPIPRRDFT